MQEQQQQDETQDQHATDTVLEIQDVVMGVESDLTKEQDNG